MSNAISPFVINTPNSGSSNNYVFFNEQAYQKKLKEKLQNTDADNKLIYTPDDKPKRGRPKKDSSSSGQVIPVSVGGYNHNENSNDSTSTFHKAYQETDAILKTAIGQTDVLINDVASDLTKIREAKAMTNKYRYITDLSGTMSALISTKINAAKELNNSISRANDMEYKMQKELKAMESTKDDNKAIMDMYNAFMSVPVGTYKPQLGPSIQDVTLPKNTNLSTIDIITSQMNANSDPGYQQYLANMTPEQNRMRYENDPNIQTVVVYDQSSGRKWFDVIDMRTGASVPNVAKPDEFLLDDTRPDIANGVARNSNINMTYPLKVVGERSSLYDY